MPGMHRRKVLRELSTPPLARTRTSGTCQAMTGLGLSQLGGADLDQGGQRRGQWPGKVIDRYSYHLQQEHDYRKGDDEEEKRCLTKYRSAGLREQHGCLR